MPRYSATITEHFHDPRNDRTMTDFDAVGVASLDGRPPFVTIYLRMDQDRVRQATFQAAGCGFLIACCSALTEFLTGRSVAACRTFTAEQLIEALDGLPPDKRFCAPLAIAALRHALEQLEQSVPNSPTGAGA